ncbi:hypothetical protein N7492_009959 [Penicillium capsulatum]|uniref:Uncharacterized protein n=1 Tax=Penicillium capsulatum TaxID=69766 RepID=A0A9W9HQ80_9EURO|nr:hypothetical protein N7492_009959 [Penicillium capsulatum]
MYIMGPARRDFKFGTVDWKNPQIEPTNLMNPPFVLGLIHSMKEAVYSRGGKGLGPEISPQLTPFDRAHSKITLSRRFLFSSFANEDGKAKYNADLGRFAIAEKSGYAGN